MAQLIKARHWGREDGLFVRIARRRHVCQGVMAWKPARGLHALTQRERRGRRAMLVRYRGHVEACGYVIEPGDRYVEYIGEAPAYQSGIRYSVPCALAAWGPIEGVLA